MNWPVIFAIFYFTYVLPIVIIVFGGDFVTIAIISFVILTIFLTSDYITNFMLNQFYGCFIVFLISYFSLVVVLFLAGCIFSYIWFVVFAILFFVVLNYFQYKIVWHKFFPTIFLTIYPVVFVIMFFEAYNPITILLVMCSTIIIFFIFYS